MGHDFRNGADSVGKIFFTRKDGGESALSEVAVTNFAATWTADSTTFADGITWGVVVMNVTAFGISNFHSVDNLGKTERGEGDDVHSLSHATSKEGRTVSARKKAYLAGKGTDFGCFTAVGTDAVFDDRATNFVMNGKLKGLVILVAEIGVVPFDFFIVSFALAEFKREFVVHGVFHVVENAGAFKDVATDFFTKFTFGPFVDAGLNFWIRENELVFLGGSIDKFLKFALKIEDRLDVFYGPMHGFDDDVFGYFVCTGFDHNDFAVFAGDNEVERGFFAFFRGEEGFKFAVNAADAETGDRAIERNAGVHEGGASGKHGDDVGAERGIHGKDSSYNLDFLAVAFREERTDWAVDETAD